MPQLDFVTYVYQFNWLLVVFSLFYIFTLKFVFPSISAALKARSRRLILDRKDVLSMKLEQKKSSLNYEIIWENILRIHEKQVKFIQATKADSFFKQANAVLTKLNK
jgi:F0F1-type ATP synthase membrane subunit b/b'